jgi:hypothetical protein
MTGQLIATFLERCAKDDARWLEIWMFRDQTLNLVVAAECGCEAEEYVFPCAGYQLAGMLSGSRMKTVNEKGFLTMWREENQVIVEVQQQDLERSWRLCVPVVEVSQAISEIEVHAGKFVA